MTQEQHPITPSPELVQQWLDNDDFPFVTGTFDLLSITRDRLNSVIVQAGQWYADQELEACCEWLSDQRWKNEALADAVHLRAARRPKAPSLKEQALADLDTLVGLGRSSDTIRRALELLPDDIGTPWQTLDTKPAPPSTMEPSLNACSHHLSSP